HVLYSYCPAYLLAPQVDSSARGPPDVLAVAQRDCSPGILGRLRCASTTPPSPSRQRPEPFMTDSKLHYRTFIILLLIVTLAFGRLLLPYYGAVFWGTILAISFMPLHRRLLTRLPGRPNLSALLTVLLVLLLVILPLTLL